MILTCPACDTKYVVKDGAIPPGGRQVRCASCKHSWHQDPDASVGEPESEGMVDFGGPPEPAPDQFEQPAAEVPEAEAAQGTIAAEPQPAAGEAEDPPWGAVSPEPVESTIALGGASRAGRSGDGRSTGDRRRMARAAVGRGCRSTFSARTRTGGGGRRIRRLRTDRG